MKISQLTKWKFHMKIYSIWNFYILHLKIQILRSVKFMNSVRQLISAEFRKSINSSLTSKFSFCHLKKWIKKGILCLGTTQNVLLIKNTKHKMQIYTCPFLKTFNVGYLFTLYLWQRSCWLSQSILASIKSVWNIKNIFYKLQLTLFKSLVS